MMDLDFPLILVSATFITGIIWLIDAVVLAPKRRTAATDTNAEATEVVLSEPVVVEYSKSFFPVLAVVLVLRSFLYEPFQIPSGSMLPTLKIGDFILVSKFEYGLRLPVIGTKVVSLGDPVRGDVMVFKFPQNPKINYIKRVVGVPGDRVRYINKRLTINGEPVKERLIAQLPPGDPQEILLEEQLGTAQHQIQKSVYQRVRSRLQPPTSLSSVCPNLLPDTEFVGEGAWVVPEGYYFAMGDNRDNSNDSRFWGCIPDELVVGKAVLVWMHWDNFWSLPSFAHVGGID